MMENYETLISVEHLQQVYQSGNVVILDCTYSLADLDKGRQTYLKAHIPGAFFMDTAHDLSGPIIKGKTGRHPLPDPVVLTHTLKACGLNQDSQVIAYDQSNGVYASRAWWLLNWLGHVKVAVLDGGFQRWIEFNNAVDNQWPAPKKGNFIAHLHAELTVDKKGVRLTSSPLVDSREYKRYIGEIEPIDPIAGHIPGAVCIPYQDNVDENGLWRELDFLKKKFDRMKISSEPPVFYCGSGVTACHNILAYKIATGNDAKLYGGSWSEWILDQPIAIGAEAEKDPG